MIYKFKSKASGDLIMMAEHAEPILRMMGKEPGAQGIVLHADMALAIERLENALREHGLEPSANTDRSQGHSSALHEDKGSASAVSLHVRAQPMLKMLRLALAEDADVLWGV